MGELGQAGMVEASPVDFDIVIVGAGISGVNAAYRVQERCPEKSYTLLEARDSIGGTWDLFKYPGIRSDSDLHTFGFRWRPWTHKSTIAEGHLIKDYMIDSAREYGIDKHIQYRHSLTTANWSTSGQAWSLKVDADGQQKNITCRFLFMATGYYDYHQALSANIPGIDKFQGQIIHPQFWPENLDYKDKDVVIIGSGATAITLLPNMVKEASHVTMLQRSPTYVIALPKVDKIAEFSKKFLPLSWAAQLTRLRYIILPFLFFKFCRAFPNAARNILLKGAAKQLPPGYPLKPNFDPTYNPWEQRLCVSPSGDFYKCIREGKASVVTGHIKTITEKSIVLKDSDTVLHPDIIVTATGLKISTSGGAKMSIDGNAVRIADKHLWKGALIEDIPNCCITIGYTNASWTLGADATAIQFTRILNSMKKNHQTSVTPAIDPDSKVQDTSVLNLNSTYIVKAQGDLPKAGNVAPWLPRSSYILDLWEADYGSIQSGLKYR